MQFPILLLLVVYPSVSIIIPAHNEASVIDRNLAALGALEGDSHFEIIVVCNGCCDETPVKVKKFEWVILVETELASKTNALNLGDRKAKGEIRIFMDADVMISAEHVKRLVQTMIDENKLAVTPNIKMIFDQASWWVRAYYSIWLQLPYVKDGFMGSGIYAVSLKGRERFDQFPDVISDDGFVSSLFSKDEVLRVDDTYSMVVAPKTLAGLITIKTRSRLGQYELLKKFSIFQSGSAKHWAASKGRFEIIGLFLKPQNWARSCVYVGINLICRYKAKNIFTSGVYYSWETDQTSRT